MCLFNDAVIAVWQMNQVFKLATVFPKKTSESMRQQLKQSEERRAISRAVRVQTCATCQAEVNVLLMIVYALVRRHLQVSDAPSMLANIGLSLIRKLEVSVISLDSEKLQRLFGIGAPAAVTGSHQ